MLAPRPTTKLEDHTLSAVRDCLFNLFAATLHIGGRSSIRNLRTRHDVVTGTHKHSFFFKYLNSKNIIASPGYGELSATCITSSKFHKFIRLHVSCHTDIIYCFQTFSKRKANSSFVMPVPYVWLLCGYSHTTTRRIGVYQIRCTAYKVAPDDELI